MLIDLLMPTSMCGANASHEGKSLEGQEMPIGTFLAFLAAKHGAKYIIVFTDSNHHDNPCSAMVDVTSKSYPVVFKVEEADVIIVNGGNNRMVKNKQGEWVKNWKEALAYLQSDQRSSSYVYGK